jgi:membrane associated rhomboid family serine protease
VFQQVRLSEGINIWWVIVAMFFHGSIIHIIVNSATLFYFGLILENDHKNLNYLAVLVGLGIISLFFQYISLAISIKTGVLSFAGQPNTLFMGTSGAICGIVAISCLKRPCAEIYPIFIPVARVNIISGVLIFSVLSLLCLLVFGVFSFGLAHTSHITGIIFGLLYGVERYGVRRAKHIFYDFFR